jgi:hypothetical protein
MDRLTCLNKWRDAKINQIIWIWKINIRIRRIRRIGKKIIRIGGIRKIKINIIIWIVTLIRRRNKNKLANLILNKGC